MKNIKTYETVEVEVVLLHSADIITTSDGNPGAFDGPEDSFDAPKPIFDLNV